jgi:emp24/gp25L/p24 family/GOLD
VARVGGQLSTVNRMQKYFRTRENRNFSTVRSTEGRIWRFSLVEVGMMVGMAGVQVLVVRFFFQGARKGMCVPLLFVGGWSLRGLVAGGGERERNSWLTFDRQAMCEGPNDTIRTDADTGAYAAVHTMLLLRGNAIRGYDRGCARCSQALQSSAEARRIGSVITIHLIVKPFLFDNLIHSSQIPLSFSPISNHTARLRQLRRLRPIRILHRLRGGRLLRRALQRREIKAPTPRQNAVPPVML